MNQHSSLEYMHLYQRVDEILHYLWDPIRLKGISQARDEYQSYVPQVCSLLINRAPKEDIIDYLVETSVVTMGLGNASNAEKHAQEITEILTDHREFIFAKSSKD